MEEKFRLTARNWESYIKEKGIFTFDALRKPIFARIFELKEDLEVVIQEKDANGDKLVLSLKEGEIVARSPDGQIWPMSRYSLETNYQALPLKENPDGTYTQNWASQRE